MAAEKAPVRVVITGAAGQIGYSLIPLVASGSVFGPAQPVILHLLDIEPAKKALEGVVMEIQDALYPLLAGIVATISAQEAFTGVNFAILLGGFPRKAGMSRADLMSKNSPIFVEQGQALNKYADRNVKVLVVANPANTNCLVAATNAPDIPKANFSALTRLDQNRARFQIAKRFGVNCGKVHNVTIWGNHSKTMVPDSSNGFIEKGGENVPIPKLAGPEDEKWLLDEFTPTVQNRGTTVIEMRGLSSAMSAAKASADHVHDWFHGTAKGETASMAVFSDGSYGAPAGVFFSFPVTISNGSWTIVKDLPLSDRTKAMLKATGEELLAEKVDAGLA